FRHGRTLGEAGLVTEATTHFTDLTPRATRILGPDHPDTLTIRHNLAYWRGDPRGPAPAPPASHHPLPPPPPGTRPAPPPTPSPPPSPARSGTPAAAAKRASPPPPPPPSPTCPPTPRAYSARTTPTRL